MPDLIVNNHFSIFILQADSEAGDAWITEHIPADAQVFGGGVAVEPRCIEAIVEGARDDGLEVICF